MPSEYCFKCGGKAEWISAKPKFCPSCGDPFNRAMASNERHREEEEEEYESEHIPSMAKLRRSVVANTDLLGKQNMGELIQMAAPRQSYTPRPSTENSEGKDLLNKVRQECSSSRGNPIDIA